MNNCDKNDTLKSRTNISKLKKISVSGFKSIGDTQVVEIGDVNILIGANGSGKSSFVSFF